MEQPEQEAPSVLADAPPPGPVGEGEESGVQIQEADDQGAQEVDQNTNGEEEDEDEDESTDIEIGDRILIESKAYGKVVGRVYFISDDLLRVIPDGVSNRVNDFPVIDEGIDPDLGVTEVLVEKGPRTNFTEFSGFREGQVLDSYTADGTYVRQYKILNISKEDDSIVIQDFEAVEPELKLEFNGRGIPRDLPFAVLRVAPIAEADEVAESNQLSEENAEEELEEEVEFETVGEIELPTFVVAEQLSAKELIFPEIQQKEDLIRSIVQILDAPLQRDPVVLKKVRAFAESASVLKNSIIKRSEAGEVIGQRQPSVETLAEVVQSHTPALARPVLDTKRVLQLDELKDTDQVEKDTDELLIQTLGQTLERMETWLDKTHDGLPVAEDAPRFYSWISGLLTRFPMGDLYQGSGYSFKKDAEYFRQEAPTTDTIEGLPKMSEVVNVNDDEFKTSDELVGEVSTSLRRGLSGTVRKGPHGGLVLVVPEDKATAKSFVLFPPTVSRQIGSTRTGTLAEDVIRSHVPLESISDIVDSLGGITELTDAGRILLLKAEGATIANVPVKDYLESILSLQRPKGPGDIQVTLRDLDLHDLELTKDQMEVLDKRVEEVIQGLRQYIRSLRTALQTEKAQASVQQLLDDNAFMARLSEIAGTFPTLSEGLSNLAKRTPAYKTLDTAITGYLLAYHQDLFLTAMGTNEQSISREQVRATRDSFLTTLRQIRQIQTLNKEKGAPPIVNPCPHTNTLTQIRKVKDETKRIALLAKFITKFKGGREENWLTCVVCDKHLLCHHELLQVQQFLHPREHDTIQKEIVLGYAGGRYGANFICRNCGVPIQQLDFDKNIEFDDEGRPMSGRAELIDEEAAEEEELMNALKAPIGAPEDADYGSPRKNELYQIAKVITDRIGVALDREGYEFVVEIANQRLSMQPNPQQYAELVGRKKGLPDYPTHMARLAVGLVACLTLVNIQSHVPDYTVRYVIPGCKAGFDGYPLVEESEPTASIGIQYIACALNGIREASGAWGQTGWQNIRSDQDREAGILKQLVNVMKIIVTSNPGIQISLEKKREYLRTIYGADAAKGRPSEKIPDEFLPRIEPAQEAVENAAREPTVAISAKNTESAIAWIRTAHQLARENVHRMEGSPFAETGCCFSHATQPLSGLKAPALGPTLALLRPGARQTLFLSPYLTRLREDVQAGVQTAIVYRIFTTLCWQGERVGLPHEFGYDYKCDWCGLQLPIEYLFPDIDKYGQVIFNDDILIQSFQEQGIPITQEAFASLLDIAHARNTFRLYLSPMPDEPKQALSTLGNLEVPPTEDWAGRINALLAGIEKIPPGATEIEVSAAFGPISDILGTAEQFIQEQIQSFEVTGRIKREHRLGWQRYASILQEPVDKFQEIARSYFLVPFSRILTKYSRKSLRVATFYGLSPDHREDIAGILDKHTDVLAIIERSPLDEVTLGKIEVFVQKLASFLHRGTEIRKSRLPYGQYLIPFLNRMAVSVPLYELLNPSIYPKGTDPSIVGLGGKSRTTLLSFVWSLLDLYNTERQSYSSESIRLALLKESEKEKNSIIQFYDKMTEEEKRVEKVKQKLGLGRWAIGGTKLIWAYDKEQYDKERVEHMAEYEAGAGRDGVAPEGRGVDALGFMDFGGEYDNTNNGYDAMEESPDDF